MLTLTDIPSDKYLNVCDIDSLFNTLSVSCLLNYMNKFDEWGIFLDKDIINMYIMKGTPINLMPMTSKFGSTTMDKLATGYKVYILAAEHIRRKRNFYCWGTTFGENIFRELVQLGMNNNYLWIYSPNGNYLWKVYDIRQYLNITWEQKTR